MRVGENQSKITIRSVLAFLRHCLPKTTEPYKGNYVKPTVCPPEISKLIGGEIFLSQTLAVYNQALLDYFEVAPEFGIGGIVHCEKIYYEYTDPWRGFPGCGS